MLFTHSPNASWLHSPKLWLSSGSTSFSHWWRSLFCRVTSSPSSSSVFPRVRCLTSRPATSIDLPSSHEPCFFPLISWCESSFHTSLFIWSPFLILSPFSPSLRTCLLSGSGPTNFTNSFFYFHLILATLGSWFSPIPPQNIIPYFMKSSVITLWIIWWPERQWWSLISRSRDLWHIEILGIIPQMLSNCGTWFRSALFRHHQGIINAPRTLDIALWLHQPNINH